MSKLFKFSIHKGKANEETKWNFQAFMNSKKNSCRGNYMRKYGTYVEINGNQSIWPRCPHENGVNASLAVVVYDIIVSNSWKLLSSWIRYLSFSLALSLYWFKNETKPPRRERRNTDSIHWNLEIRRLQLWSYFDLIWKDWDLYTGAGWSGILKVFVRPASHLNRWLEFYCI